MKGIGESYLNFKQIYLDNDGVSCQCEITFYHVQCNERVWFGDHGQFIGCQYDHNHVPDVCLQEAQDVQ